MDFAVVMYTHSDFLPIWKIISYSLNKLNLSIPIILLCDKKELFTDFYHFKDIIEYKTDKPEFLNHKFETENDIPYASRLLDCLPFIQEKYIFFTHENDLIITFNLEKILTMKDYMIKSNITRIHLSIDHSTIKYDHNGFVDKNTFIGNRVYLENDVVLTTQNNYYHYSVAPSIWDKEKMYLLLKQFYYKGYREIECKEVDTYMMSNGFNICYLGFNDNDKIINNSNRDLLYYNIYLHITGMRKIMPRFLMRDLDPIIQEYLKESNIDINDFFNLNMNK